ncbi:ribonuclease P protein component [Christiangramia forsetii]|uniref:Ribonuclease P protein component n=2 Tax=Christiangramia forsetii TaxID=411153 RepID=A0M6L5_CHRFK|nr:ribonuclease P protein component [Christiangramia forsetii]GGG30091.1 ribonuclease P protein component [Christiangramia forsetii]CAL68260.1 ribonuclease P protein component [Christiangramia forsetii KT0803]
MDESFGKSQKLKSKKLIDQLFVEGKNIKSYPLKLVYIPINNSENPELRTGVSVPKKLVKTAVKRNRIKRLMREVYRKNKYLVTKDLVSSYAFMFIHISREEMTYEKLEQSMIKILERFREKIHTDEKTNQ